MFTASLKNGITPKPSTSYSFTHQEQDYFQFRPRWAKRFALAALQRLGIQHDDKTNRGSRPNTASPVIVSIGSGAGSDAEAFLQLGCIVYGVEPNAEFRRLTTKNLGAKYPGRFFSVDGNAHQLNLPATLKPDMIVCAQALHTFRSDVLHFASSEALARRSWKNILPDDNQNRVSIWYYNLDPLFPVVRDLDLRLRKVSPSYANSKTTFLHSPLFEPSQFQHYINADKMTVSTAQPVDQSHLNFENVKKWLKSFSFYPKDSVEETRVLAELTSWFKLYKNKQNEIALRYIGFIAQGPLRTTPYFQNQTSSFLPDPSPLTLAQRNIGIGVNNSDFWSSANSSTASTQFLPDSSGNFMFADKQPASTESSSLAANALLALAFAPFIGGLLLWWFKPTASPEKDFMFLLEQQELLQEYQERFPIHSFNRAKKLGMFDYKFSDVLTLMQSTNILISKTLMEKQISSSSMSTIIHNMKKIDNLLTRLSDPKLSHEIRKAVRDKAIRERRVERKKLKSH